MKTENNGKFKVTPYKDLLLQNMKNFFTDDAKTSNVYLRTFCFQITYYVANANQKQTLFSEVAELNKR